MCNFIIFLFGGVPLDFFFFYVKNVALPQKRFKNTNIISFSPQKHNKNSHTEEGGRNIWAGTFKTLLLNNDDQGTASENANTNLLTLQKKEAGGKKRPNPTEQSADIIHSQG